MNRAQNAIHGAAGLVNTQRVDPNAQLQPPIQQRVQQQIPTTQLPPITQPPHRQQQQQTIYTPLMRATVPTAPMQQQTPTHTSWWSWGSTTPAPRQNTENNETAREIRGLRNDMRNATMLQMANAARIEQQNLEMERRRIGREEQQRLRRNGPPDYGTIRYWLERPDGVVGNQRIPHPSHALHKVILFAQRHAQPAYRNLIPVDTSFTFQQHALAAWFWEKIRIQCRSEQEARDCIVELKNNLQTMINNSDLTDEMKEAMNKRLNTHDHKESVLTAAAVFGVVMLACIAPVCISLALQGAFVQCAAASLLCAALTVGPYFLVDKFYPNQRYFPTDKGAVSEPRAFNNWVIGLVNESLRIDGHIEANRAAAYRAAPR